MPQSRGFRVKTRKLLRKRGNFGFSDHILSINQLKKGNKVVIYINPKYHNGMPHRRYHGKVGSVLGRRGKAFIIEVSKGNRLVKLIIPSEHLKLHTNK